MNMKTNKLIAMMTLALGLALAACGSDEAECEVAADCGVVYEVTGTGDTSQVKVTFFNEAGAEVEETVALPWVWESVTLGRDDPLYLAATNLIGQENAGLRCVITVDYRPHERWGGKTTDEDGLTICRAVAWNHTVAQPGGTNKQPSKTSQAGVTYEVTGVGRATISKANATGGIDSGDYKLPYSWSSDSFEDGDYASLAAVSLDGESIKCIIRLNGQLTYQGSGQGCTASGAVK